MKGVLLLCSLLFALLCVAPACAHKPPNLGPVASKVWTQHEVQKNLDTVRDIAVDANTQGLLSLKATQYVVKWHRTAITLVHNAPSGWVSEVLKGLDELQVNLDPVDYRRISNYVALAKTVLQEIK